MRDYNKKVLENSKDLTPDTKDNVIKLLDSSWEEKNKKTNRYWVKKAAEKLLKNITSNEKVNLTKYEGTR